MNTTLDKVRGVIVDITAMSEQDIKLESALDEIGLDSLDMVEIAMGIEDEFDIEVKDEEFEACKTIEDVVKLIDKLKP